MGDGEQKRNYQEARYREGWSPRGAQKERTEKTKARGIGWQGIRGTRRDRKMDMK